MTAMPLEARLAHVEGTVVQMGDRLNGFAARFNNLDRKLDELDTRLTSRIDELDARLSARINELDAQLSARIDGLAAHMNARFDAIDKRFAEIDRRFTWLIGLVIVSILLPVVQRFVLH